MKLKVFPTETTPPPEPEAFLTLEEYGENNIRVVLVEKDGTKAAAPWIGTFKIGDTGKIYFHRMGSVNSSLVERVPSRDSLSRVIKVT
jgi:hypothetical protein